MQKIRQTKSSLRHLAEKERRREEERGRGGEEERRSHEGTCKSYKTSITI